MKALTCHQNMSRIHVVSGNLSRDLSNLKLFEVKSDNFCVSLYLRWEVRTRNMPWRWISKQTPDLLIFEDNQGRTCEAGWLKPIIRSAYLVEIINDLITNRGNSLEKFFCQGLKNPKNLIFTEKVPIVNWKHLPNICTWKGLQKTIDKCCIKTPDKPVTCFLFSYKNPWYRYSGC